VGNSVGAKKDEIGVEAPTVGAPVAQADVTPGNKFRSEWEQQARNLEGDYNRGVGPLAQKIEQDHINIGKEVNAGMYESKGEAVFRLGADEAQAAFQTPLGALLGPNGDGKGTAQMMRKEAQAVFKKNERLKEAMK